MTRVPVHTPGRQYRRRGSAATLERWPSVFASICEPCGARRRWVIVTAACPYCSGRRVHYAPDLASASGARRTGCRKGAVYWIVVRIYRRTVRTGAAA